MISEMINVIDLPGIEDSILNLQIEEWLIKSADNIIPVVVVDLTCGGFTDLKHFEGIVPIL